MSAPSPPRWRAPWRSPLIRRILLAIAVLALLLLIAAEIIFRTNLPRNLVISAVEKQTGLRFDAKSLSTGFLGHTTLYDVAISLPLADKPFLQISQMSLDHTWLPTLLLGGSLTIQRVDLDGPYLTLHQGADKTWNFQEIAQLLTPENPSTKPDENILLPTVEIKNATVVVSDEHHRSATIEHVQFNGQPQGDLLWTCNLQVPGHADITAKIATGRLWAHDIDFQFDDLKTWLSPWIPSWPQPAKLQGQWSGRFDSGKLQGQLTLSRAGYSAYALSGPIQISATPDGAELQPTGALLKNANTPALDAQFTSGDIIISSTGIEAKNIGLQFPRGYANLDAAYQIADSTAKLHAAWHDLGITSKSTHSGEINVNFTAANGNPTFDASLKSTGTFDTQSWDASLTATGAGDIHNLNATITAQKFVVSAEQGQSLNLSGFVAAIGATSGGLALRELQFRNSESLAGQGGYSFSKKVAWFTLDGRGLPMPRHPPYTADLDLNIWANPQRVHLSELYISSEPLTLYLNGDYVFSLPKPVEGHLSLIHNPQLAESEESAIPYATNFQSNVDITGTLVPVDLAFSGTANGTDLYYRDRYFGDLSVNLSGTIRNDQIAVTSQDIHLLGGQWSIDGTWPVRNSLFRIDNLSVQHLSLPLATGDPQIAGTLDGKWSIDVRELSLAGITVEGAASAHNLIIHDNPNLAADEIDIPYLRIANGWARTGAVNLKYKSGSAQLRAITTLANPQRLWLNLTSKSWPLVLVPSASIPPSSPSPGTPPLSPSPGTPAFGSEAQARRGEGRGGGLLTSKAQLDLDLSTRSAIGSIDLSLDALWNSNKLASLQTSIDVNRRILRFNDIKILSHDAATTATGKAAVDLDHPFRARADLSWSEWDLANLAANSPELKSLTGKITGSLHVAPTTDPRPIGPLQIDLQLNSEHVKFKNIAVGNFQATAFLAPDRFVLNDSPDHPTQLAIAGGQIHFWGRITKHVDDIYQAQIQAILQNLELDTVIPSGAKTNRTPGQLSGQITVVTQLHRPDLTFGQGSLRLNNSDLAGAGAIAFIYNLLHLLHNPNKPQGNGSIDFTIQGRDAIVTSMRYYDRGAEIRISGNIYDLRHLPHSPVNLIALASARPLKQINIPGLADIDQALNAVQQNAITVRITGSLDNPKEKQVLFSEVNQDLKNMLFGNSAAGQGVGE